MKNANILAYVVLQALLFITVNIFSSDMAMLEFFSVIVPITLLLINTKVSGQALSLCNRNREMQQKW